ncbi:MAG: DnaA regulatory inactivator Hda [Betaproteobacteria bacterium]|nr:DnaA regulatory inactivator Hda [Betaproteobacteria bacterium]
MEQLLLELLPPDPPQFANFLPGPNREVLAHLAARLQGGSAETSIYLWGPLACGKTHLLRATLAQMGQGTYWHPGDPWPSLESQSFVAVDDVERLDEQEQARLFTLLNQARTSGGLLLAAGALPPARLALREDVRTRLGWGLVLELKTLSDEEKPLALVDYARTRGFTIPIEVIDYMLCHGRRDMGTLLRQIATLDRQSLLEKRLVSLAMARRLIRTDRT